MGLFSSLFKSQQLDEQASNHLLTLTKVGLAFLSGSDGGHIVISHRKNNIDFHLQCQSVFFEYRDNLGISEESLLKNHCGKCPIDVWEYFKSYVNIDSIAPAKHGKGETLRMTSNMELEERNTAPYLDSLHQAISSEYPGLRIDRNSTYGSLTIVVTSHDNALCSYR